jgi:flagellar protein FlbB
MGRVIVLLLLIAVMAAAGIVWFDYLNVIDAKTVISPLTRFIGLEPRSQPKTGPDEIINLDRERLEIRLEVLSLEKLELDTIKRDLDTKSNEIAQKAQELEDRQKQLEDWTNSIKHEQEDAENRDRNIESNARYLNGMPPERAVGIMSEMDDQDVIDVLRKTDEMARAAGTNSIVSYWLSLMEPARAAELQRKMAGRPQSL